MENSAVFFVKFMKYDRSGYFFRKCEEIEFDEKTDIVTWLKPDTDEEYEFYVNPVLGEPEYDGMEVVSEAYILNDTGGTLHPIRSKNNNPFKKDRK